MIFFIVNYELQIPAETLVIWRSFKYKGRKLRRLLGNLFIVLIDL